jgi:hypothetical protein
MNNEASFTHVSFQRAFESAVQSLTVLRGEEEKVPRTLNEDLLKRLLVESFAHQFEDDTSSLEKRVREILEEQVKAFGNSGDSE